MSNFRTIDRQTGFLLPPSVDEWLPERHLARFVVEVIDGLDLRAMVGAYRGAGSAAHHPRMLLGVLVYGYATGVFSSRKLERATYDSVAFRFIAANDHPDHDTIKAVRSGGGFSKRSKLCSFRFCCWRARWACCKWERSASTARRSTPTPAATARCRMSMPARSRRNCRPKSPIWLAKAEATAADAADLPDDLSILDELARREERLRKIAAARTKIEARAKERHAREQAEHDAKLAARAAKTAATGKKPGGKPPEPPAAGPAPGDQINLTDEDSRIMPVAGGGFDQCYNAQAAVAASSLLVVAVDVVQAPNDKQQLEPMLDKIGCALPGELERARNLLADAGLFHRAANSRRLRAAAGIAPLIKAAMGRQPHHPLLAVKRFEAAASAPDDPDAGRSHGASAQ